MKNSLTLTQRETSAYSMGQKQSSAISMTDARTVCRKDEFPYETRQTPKSAAMKVRPIRLQMKQSACGMGTENQKLTLSQLRLLWVIIRWIPKYLLRKKAPLKSPPKRNTCRILADPAMSMRKQSANRNVQNANYAAMKDVPTLSKKEESVGGTGHHANNAVTKVASTML